MSRSVVLWLVVAVVVVHCAPTAKPPTKKTEAVAAVVKKPSTSQPKTKSSADNGTAASAGDTTASTNGTTPKPTTKCSAIRTAIGSVQGITQNCTVHEDCLGASCVTAPILAHSLAYNFSVSPCEKPTVDVSFKIVDREGSEIEKKFLKSDTVIVPKGNLSYTGMAETESKIVVVLDKTEDVTHFRLDFGVDYRVLSSDKLHSLFSHTLVPMLSLDYNKKLCAKPTEPPKTTKPNKTVGDEELIYGIIPKDMVKDKTKLALLITAATLAVVLLVGVIYFVIARNRDHGYRTYVSTDENMHLTKGNDGFEPLDDSDID